MTADTAAIQGTIMDVLVEIASLRQSDLSSDTVLVGPGAVIKSLELVELLLILEEFTASTLGAEFDWVSDAAMSPRTSPFRTIGSLGDHLLALSRPSP